MEFTLRRTKAALVIAAAVASGIVGVSYAAIPSSTGTISACRDNKGTLKVIDTDSGQSCNANQQLLTWSQQGPQGTPGISGHEIVTTTGSASSSHVRAAFAFCPSGKKVIGGGAQAFTSNGSGEFNPTGLVAIAQSYPSGETGWGSYANETEPTDVVWALRAYAICANVG